MDLLAQDDETLMSYVAVDNTAAFELLYDRYAAQALGLITRIVSNRAEAEEILQEAYWRAWDKRHTFSRQKGNFRSWLFGIARNLAIDTLRRRSVRPQAAQSDNEVLRMERQPDTNMNVPEAAGALMLHDKVQEALAELPDEQAQVIELAFYKGLTRREIAVETDSALGTVHTRARLALRKLSDLLREAPEEN